MSAEGAAPGGVILSTELLPAETLERSKTGNKFEKTKCAKPGDVMFTEVGTRRTVLSVVSMIPGTCLLYVRTGI